MSADTAGGPAFPTPDNWRADSGMTLRDYFAAKAMQALIGSPVTGLEDDPAVIRIPRWAYEMADAMLKERQA